MEKNKYLSLHLLHLNITGEIRNSILQKREKDFNQNQGNKKFDLEKES